jgi:hypothetical protein
MSCIEVCINVSLSRQSKHVGKKNSSECTFSDNEQNSFFPSFYKCSLFPSQSFMYACPQTYFDPQSYFVYCSNNCVAIFLLKEYRILFAASCIEYSLILVKLICPNNIHTTDKKQKLIFHSMLSK